MHPAPPLERHVLRQVDFAHAAGSERRDDPVVRDPVVGLKRSSVRHGFD
jgi:hypothetical protein